MADLSIIIVNWNTRQLLDGCLASIYGETKNINFEIFVVDNASSDGSAEMIKEKYPAINLIINKKNCGFAAANNQAIKEAQGKYILILNSDTIILDGALNKLLDVLRSRPEVGILGAKTLNKDRTIQKTARRDPTLLTQLFLPSKIKKLFQNWRPFKEYYFDDFDYEKETFVPQLQGSFLLVKKEVFDKIGPFDEKFFIWFEEVDFCLRARKTGYKILYSPAGSIVHYGGESFSKLDTLKKQTLYSRSLLHYFWKNKPKWQWFILYLLKFPLLFF